MFGFLKYLNSFVSNLTRNVHFNEQIIKKQNEIRNK